MIRTEPRMSSGWPVLSSTRLKPHPHGIDGSSASRLAKRLFANLGQQGQVENGAAKKTRLLNRSPIA